ncbi:MAG TPA: hypothetical protein RMH99_02545 [Sandaracinaceae bacterium LLY-WYZ-13_1]|nr:hypothetical protein [Sandaracinaceae bacterium LLY-WYZ-13_1]
MRARGKPQPPRRGPGAPWVAAALWCALAAPTQARAQERTARLAPPTCESLPFAHERLEELLAVELSVHRIRLVDGEAQDVVRYDPVRCGDPGSPLRVVLERRGVIAARERISNEPPRALALYLAELMRTPFDAPVADLIAGTATATELLAPTPHAAAALATPSRRSSGATWLVLERGGERAPDDEDAPDRLENARLFAVGVEAELAYNPENQAFLVGPRLALSLRAPFYPFLRLRLDAGVSTGASDWGVNLGTTSVGFEVDLAAGDRDGYLEVGPRMAAVYGWAVSLPYPQIRQLQDAMITLGASVRGAVRVGEAQWLTLGVEVMGPVAGRILFTRSHPFDRAGGGVHDASFVARLGFLLE